MDSTLIIVSIVAIVAILTITCVGIFGILSIYHREPINLSQKMKTSHLEESIDITSSKNKNE